MVLDKTYRGRLRPHSHYALGVSPRWGRLRHPGPGAGSADQRRDGDPGTAQLGALELRADQRRNLSRPALPAPGCAGPLPPGTPPWCSGRRSPTASPVVGWSVIVGAGVSRLRTAVPGVGQLLRSDLDLDRPARRCPADSCARRWTCPSDCGSGDSDRRPRGVVHGGLAQATPADCYPTTRLLGGSIRRWSRWLSCWRRLRTGSHRTCPHRAGRPAALPPRVDPGWRTDAALARTGARVTTVGRCCGLAGNFGARAGPLRSAGEGRRARTCCRPYAPMPTPSMLTDGFLPHLDELADRKARDPRLGRAAGRSPLSPRTRVPSTRAPQLTFTVAAVIDPTDRMRQRKAATPATSASVAPRPSGESLAKASTIASRPSKSAGSDSAMPPVPWVTTRMPWRPQLAGRRHRPRPPQRGAVRRCSSR